MAQAFTATANSNATIGYALYGSSSWSKGSSNGACQGAYQKTSASGSRVGVMLFSGAGTALKGKIIRNIVFSMKKPTGWRRKNTRSDMVWRL